MSNACCMVALCVRGERRRGPLSLLPHQACYDTGLVWTGGRSAEADETR